MSKYILRNSVALAFAVLAAAACGSNDKTADTLAQDTSLNRDLQLANNDSAAQPALTDVPASGAPTQAPSTSAPAQTRTATPARTTPSRTATTPRPATSTARTSSGNTVTRNTGATPSSVGVIAAGSTLNLSSSSRICTNTNKVGDRFTATVRESISGSNGSVIPAGASVQVEVTQLKRSENANDNVVMGFRVVSVSFGGRTYPVSATTSYAQVDKIKNQPSGKDAQKVATGAAIGAIAGQILGKNTKSTVIGGAVGAAAGAGAAAATANYEGCVPSGGRITVTLNSGLTVNT